MDFSDSSEQCLQFTEFTSFVCTNVSEQDSPSERVGLYRDQTGSFYAGKEKGKFGNNELWKSELRMLKSVRSHQNIVRFFTTCNCFNHSNCTIIMELCDGNLEEYVNDSEIIPLTLLNQDKQPEKIKARSYFKNNLLNLLHQTTKGLNYLHKKNIIHCNIKLSSVLLIESPVGKTVAKLGELGFSKKLETSIVSKSFATPNGTSRSEEMYKAYECLVPREPRWSKASDVFALGILIFYALSRNHPFGLTNQQTAITTKIRNKDDPNFAELRNLKEYTEEQKITMVDMIKKMINHDPDKRFKIEEVEFHPTFYSDQQKIDFLLTIYTTVRKSKPEFLQNILNYYDEGLLIDKNAGKTKRFKIKDDNIFKNYQYFRQMENRPKNWQLLKGKICNVQSLLKALRDKVTHACDGNNDVPAEFEKDFNVTTDSYDSAKFLSVFLSDCPQLLVHLYTLYENKNVAIDFYPK